MILIIKVANSPDIEDMALSIVSSQVQWAELGMAINLDYIGLLWEGDKPSEDTIASLLKWYGIELEK